MTSFPESIKETYRVITTKYGNGETEETLPLGSWRKGGGLGGKRGHVYVKGTKQAGVWLIHKNWPTVVASLTAAVTCLQIMQSGDGEVTFAVSWAELPKILPLIWAKKRPVLTEARKAALAKASVAGEGHRFKASDVEKRPVGASRLNEGVNP